MHNHAHHHHHQSLPERQVRVFMAGVLVNLAFVAVEALAASWSNSMALWSDAAHNLSDVFGLLLSLFAFRLSSGKQHRSYTYGYAKSTVLAGLLNSLLLLLMVVLLMCTAILRFNQVQEIQGQWVVITSAAGILVNGFTAWLFIRDGSHSHDINVRAAFLHMAADALVSLGVLISGLIVMYTGWTLPDPIMGFLIALVILFGTYRLLSESVRLALDGIPHGIDPEAVHSEALKVNGVQNIHHLHIWAIGSMRNAITMHVLLKAEVDRMREQEIKEELRHRLEHLNIQHATIETEFTPCAEEDCTVG
jgi:cobalt-zinc-cadmium efflux system protein